MKEPLMGSAGLIRASFVECCGSEHFYMPIYHESRRQEVIIISWLYLGLKVSKGLHGVWYVNNVYKYVCVVLSLINIGHYKPLVK